MSRWPPINIKIDQLASEIAKAMQEYAEDVSAGIEKVTDQTTNAILREVKAAAPGSGRYASGFAKNNQSTPNNRRYVVWNKKYYRLVHLLEKGHALRNGGRARAFPHMGPAERKYVPEYEEKVKQIIKNGG